MSALDDLGKGKVATAELDAGYKPTARSHYRVRVAKTEADCAVMGWPGPLFRVE